MQALLDAIARMDLPTDAQRIFHGRGGLHPGCEQWTLDAYPPVFVLTSFLPAGDETGAQLAAVGAALVEQSTAASESLREQALQLTRAVSQFKLHDGATASVQPGALPAAAAARGRQPAMGRQAQVALQIQ